MLKGKRAFIFYKQPSGAVFLCIEIITNKGGVDDQQL